MAEKVLIIHEDEASVVYHVLREYMKARKHWDLTDDEQWSQAQAMKSLEVKLELYLDCADASNRDIITVDRIKR
jgi:hypothetical protein